MKLKAIVTNSSIFDDIRAGVASVHRQANHVRIDDDVLHRLARTIDPTPPTPYAEEQWDGPIDDRIMGVVAWNAINFGSGWFPVVRKRPGLSGARTLATNWQAWCARHGVPTAAWLADVAVTEVAEVLDQPSEPSDAVHELLDHFCAAWNELGQLLVTTYGGSVTALVEDANQRAATLTTTLAALSRWDDRHAYGDETVPLLKRAQITVSHLAGALPGHPLGTFTDIDDLTAFADNLVPHVLRHHGVLIVDDELAARITAGQHLTSGEPAEVELRAVSVHAVEALSDRISHDGRGLATPAHLDHRLWQMGQDPVIKARPRHRCRCTYY